MYPREEEQVAQKQEEQVYPREEEPVPAREETVFIPRTIALGQQSKRGSRYNDIDDLANVVLPTSVDYTGAPAVPPLRMKKAKSVQVSLVVEKEEEQDTTNA